MGQLTLSEEDKQFAYAFLSDRESYHSHKESSAYTIFAVEAGFFGALLTTDWYTKIASATYCPKLIVVTFFIVPIWVLVHTFMRWQLRNRRIAALQVGTIITALLDDLKRVDTVVAQDSGQQITGIMLFMDYFVPVYSATIKGDVDIKSFPDWYRNRYIKFQQQDGTGAVTAEWFPTIGSLLILIYLGIHVIFLVK